MKNIQEIYKKIEKEAKSNKSAKARFLTIIEKDGERFIFEKKKNKIGRAIRQGDIYSHLVPVDHAHGLKLKTKQLALGSGKGAAHIAEGGIEVYEGTTLPKWCDSRTFLGPLIKVKKRQVISHPEHAHLSLAPGVYQITHQMDARTRERVND